MNRQRIALAIAAVLWVVWGLVHALAGVMTIANPAEISFAAIADATDPAAYAMNYPAGVEAALNQHGFNLAWIGLTTIVCAPFVWRGRPTAVLIAALTGGLADLGYFVFLDLGGHVKFVPGSIMTIFSACAVVLSAWALHSTRQTRPDRRER